MEGTELENVLCFTYLGSNFEADGDCEQDVKIRMAIAKSTFGKLMEIWKAEEISLKQKLRLYSAAVISIVSFGFDTWEMPQKLEDSLRGWNARCLAVTTARKRDSTGTQAPNLWPDCQAQGQKTQVGRTDTETGARRQSRPSSAGGCSCA